MGVELVVADPGDGDELVAVDVEPPSPRAAVRTASLESNESNAARLDPRFTFDAFVPASSNRLPLAAAQTVAETPGKAYNPLFIYGASGLGKTHLLHAIGNYVQDNYSKMRVLYVTTEHFLNDFIDAIRYKTTLAFKRQYRECDVLLIDDIQFIQNREALQEELFHTYNTLQGAGKQIVLTSDRTPKAIETLEERLRSRLLSGLITEIDRPDLETRLAILRTKAEYDRIALPDDVAEFIATHVRDNIRELEGAIIRVNAFANLNREPITLDLAKRVLSDLGDETPTITPDAIVDAVADFYHFSPNEVRGPRRVRPLVTARHVAMFLMRDLLAGLLVPDDREDLRRPQPHDGHQRRREDPGPDGRAPAALRPGHPAAPPAEGGGLTVRNHANNVCTARAYPVPRCARPPQISAGPRDLEQCFPLVTVGQWMNKCPLIRHNSKLSTIHTPTMTIPSLYETLCGASKRKVARP